MDTFTPFNLRNFLTESFMKKLIAIIAITTLVASCSSNRDRGELVGAKGKKWYPEKPYGMTLVPGGSFIMGKSDDDFVAVNDAPARTVTVSSFYTKTEITNGISPVLIG